MIREDGSERAVSPVVGVTLLVAIVVMLAATATWVFLGVSESPEPTPDTVLDAEAAESGAEYRLVHAGGDRLDGADLEFKGALKTDAAAGAELSNGDNVSFYPTAEEVTVVWHGEEGRSYTLKTIEVDRALPEPDEGCEWVEDESDGGTDSITIDGIVVNCDATTTKLIKIRNGGTIVGKAVSETKELDMDDGAVMGTVEVEKVADFEDGLVTGAVTSNSENVNLDNTTVEGTIEAGKVADVIKGSVVKGSIDVDNDAKVKTGSVVKGDVVSATENAKVDDSRVEGSVTAAKTVDIDDATVEGDVYIDKSDFDCTDSTIGGQNCTSYSPKDPDEW